MRFKSYALCYLLFIFVCVIASCGVPNLESSQCTEARDSVKQFYSWLLATDTDQRGERQDIYNKHISAGLRNSFIGKPEAEIYFLSNDFPKTFKVGSCKASEDQTVTLQMQIYWRDDVKTTQREFYVEAVKQGEGWLINKIFN